jgi:hypothetical protein
VGELVIELLKLLMSLIHLVCLTAVLGLYSDWWVFDSNTKEWKRG